MKDSKISAKSHPFCIVYLDAAGDVTCKRRFSEEFYFLKNALRSLEDEYVMDPQTKRGSKCIYLRHTWYLNLGNPLRNSAWYIAKESKEIMETIKNLPCNRPIMNAEDLPF